MRAQARAGWLFAAPALLLIAGVFLLPTGLGLALSLTDFDIYALADLRNLRWVGFGQYADLLHDPLFWRALRVTLLFAVLGVPAALGVSLGAALLIGAEGVRWRGLWRVLLFAPYVTSLVAGAVVWRHLLGTRFGLVNRMLGALGVAPVDWLGDPRFSVPAIVIFVTWKVFGYNMVIFSAALAAAPQELAEAARLDGAGAWARFRHVTLPAIGPVLLLSALLSAAGFLQVFDEPYVMTQGGPAQSTVTVTFLMFTQGFEWWSLGRASAVAVVLAGLTLALVAVQSRLAKARGWR